METFSTVLFVEQTPVGYTVHKGRDRIELNPAENPRRTIQPPHLVAENRGGAWHVAGTANPEIIEQVLAEVAALERQSADSLLSAAP